MIKFAKKSACPQMQKAGPMLKTRFCPTTLLSLSDFRILLCYHWIHLFEKEMTKNATNEQRRQVYFRKIFHS